nr:SHOCT domain-containing protein [Sporomusa sphaeroides]
MIYRLLSWILDLVSTWQPITVYKSSTGTGATRIIYERYARGDITREEFQQMKRDMTGYDW